MLPGCSGSPSQLKMQPLRASWKRAEDGPLLIADEIFLVGAATFLIVPRSLAGQDSLEDLEDVAADGATPLLPVLMLEPVGRFGGARDATSWRRGCRSHLRSLDPGAKIG